MATAGTACLGQTYVVIPPASILPHYCYTALCTAFTHHPTTHHLLTHLPLFTCHHFTTTHTHTLSTAGGEGGRSAAAPAPYAGITLMPALAHRALALAMPAGVLPAASPRRLSSCAALRTRTHPHPLHSTTNSTTASCGTARDCMRGYSLPPHTVPRTTPHPFATFALPPLTPTLIAVQCLICRRLSIDGDLRYPSRGAGGRLRVNGHFLEQMPPPAGDRCRLCDVPPAHYLVSRCACPRPPLLLPDVVPAWWPGRVGRRGNANIARLPLLPPSPPTRLMAWSFTP